MKLGLHAGFNKPKANDGVRHNFRKKHLRKLANKARKATKPDQKEEAKQQLMKSSSAHHRKQIQTIGQAKVSKKKQRKIDKALRYAAQDKERLLAEAQALMEGQMEVDKPVNKSKRRRKAQSKLASTGSTGDVEMTDASLSKPES